MINVKCSNKKYKYEDKKLYNIERRREWKNKNIKLIKNISEIFIN